MYIDYDYKGSIAYNSVMGESRQCLLNRLPYTKNAIKYHTENNNLGQVKFFTDELNLINKRLKLKSTI